ncbi:MAG: hypothetical protein ACREO7_14260, partial [Pseudoxanthomonas sp.]
MIPTANESLINMNSSFPRRRESLCFFDRRATHDHRRSGNPQRAIPAFAGMTSLFFAGALIGLVS